MADTSNHRIQKFDSDGRLLATWGSFGRVDGRFDGPSSVAIDSSDNVYVVDMGNSRVQKFGSLAISAEIDIKPGRNPNKINLKSKGVIIVAILTTEKFDATGVDPMSVRFGPNRALESHGRGHIEDVDGDGDTDLVLHFRTQETGIGCGDTSVSLTGGTTDNEAIEGSDSIKTVNCR